MSGYRVIKTNGKAEYEYILITPHGEEINGGDGLHNKAALDIQCQLITQEVAKRDEAWNETIDLKDARLRAQKETIEEQAEEIATLKAALNASNAALAEARKAIREIASNGLDISEGYRHVSYNAIVVWAKKQVTSWDSAAVAATTQDESESGE